jgi:hypothetical protein
MTTTLNRRLAELTGWINIIELGGALLGTPPAGEPQCRGQAKVPDWEGDWRYCGPMLAPYGMTISRTALDAVAACRGYDPKFALFAEYADEDAAMRAAIVLAVIAKLEASQ